MIKRFPLQFEEREHRALKVAAAKTGISMNQFVRDAIGEKILREQPADSLRASDADDNESAVLAKASEKPA